MEAPGAVPGATTRPLVDRPVVPPSMLVAVVAALAFATVTTLVGVSAGAPIDFLLLDLAIGLVYIGAGAVAWLRRPEVLTGPLLVDCGALNFVGSYSPTALPTLSVLGFAFEG